ncbi:MAG: hypothetical protein SGJ09_16815 [Phycisphaerae bacterium]|nr:hypothetical protein [Phycisphaerae bacterium]
MRTRAPNRSNTRSVLAPLVVAWVPTLALAVVAGCASLDPDRPAVRSLALADFTQPAEGAETEPRTYYGELPSMAVSSGDLLGDDAAPADEATSATSSSTAPAKGAAPGTGRASVGDSTANTQRWMVDGLVGQINGRPVFANEFLEPLESRLEQLAALPNRTEAKRAMLGLLHDRFETFVNSELIISEAESQLTPEQQQGLFAWLRTLQEQEVAERGGNLAEANKSIEDEVGMPLEEFLQERRNQGLSAYLLNRKVEPRTIVSWSDVERFYRQNQKLLNPPPTVRVGRIRLDKKKDAAKIEQVKAMVAAEASFVEIAAAMALEREGVFFTFEQPKGKSLAEAIDANESLSVVIKERLRVLTPGKLGAPDETDISLTWIGVIDVTEQPYRSIFEPELQIDIKAQLRAMRQGTEQSRYINRLRSRWISDDISQIEERLQAIALARYWKTV